MARKPSISDLEVQAIVKAEIQNADGYGASAVSGERATNLDYYFARPFGNEIEGRSTVVSHDVQQTVEWLMPTLMRIFTSGEDVVSFEPEEETDVEVAKQATEYVNYIWNCDNHGFLNFYSWFKDALISKNGILKIWWDDTPRTKRERYSGLSDDAFAQVAADPAVEVSEHTEHKQMQDVPDLEGTLGSVEGMDPSQLPTKQIEVSTHDMVVTRTIPGGKVCVVPVPPEEFLISKEARNIEMARLVGHRRRVTVSELREEGVSEEVLATLASDDASVMTDAEETKRNTVENITAASTTAINTAMRQVWRTEAYIKIDVDGDGIAEMRKVTVAGTGFTILTNEAWEGPRPFATLTPMIMPHRFFGLCPADLIRDIQLIKSTLTRQLLDNLYLSNNQREEVVAANIIDPDELLSSAPGRKIRVKSIDSIRPIVVPQIATQAIASLTYLDQVKENTTGVSERTQGLGADALHETASGERMLMSAAMGKIELMARVFAETGVRDAFRLILKLICMYQDKARTVRLTGGWVPMDPSGWNSDMDMKTSVGLGMGDRDQQIMSAQMVGKLQEMLLPLGFITPENIKNATELGLNGLGLKGVDRFATFPQGDAAKQPIKLPPANQKAGPDPQVEMGKAQMQQQTALQTTQMKLSADAQMSAGDAQLEQMQLASAEKMKIYQIDQEMILKKYQIDQELKLKGFGIAVDAQTDRHVASQNITSDVRTGGEPG